MDKSVDNLNGSDYTMLQAGKVYITSYYKTKSLQVAEIIRSGIGMCSSRERGTFKAVAQAEGEGVATTHSTPLPMYMPPNNSFAPPLSPESPYLRGVMNDIMFSIDGRVGGATL